jgi:AAA family ATP:ADP antiporter
MANVALIFSGQYVKYVSNLRTGLPVGVDPWGNSLKLLMAAVVAGGGMVMALMGFMQTQVSACKSFSRTPSASCVLLFILGAD